MTIGVGCGIPFDGNQRGGGGPVLIAADDFAQADGTQLNSNYGMTTAPAGGPLPANMLLPHAGDYHIAAYDGLSGGAPLINPWPSTGWLFWVGGARVVGGKVVAGSGEHTSLEDGDFTCLINLGCQDVHQRVVYQWAAVDATNTDPVGHSFANMGCLWQSLWTGMGPGFATPEGGRISAVLDGTGVYVYFSNSRSDQAVPNQAPYPLVDGQTVTVDLWAYASTATYLIQVNGVNMLSGSVPAPGSIGGANNFLPYPHRTYASVELYRPPVFGSPVPVAAPASKILSYKAWNLGSGLSPLSKSRVNSVGSYRGNAAGKYRVHL